MPSQPSVSTWRARAAIPPGPTQPIGAQNSAVIAPVLLLERLHRSLQQTSAYRRPDGTQEHAPWQATSKVIKPHRVLTQNLRLILVSQVFETTAELIDDVEAGVEVRVVRGPSEILS